MNKRVSPRHYEKLESKLDCSPVDFGCGLGEISALEIGLDAASNPALRLPLSFQDTKGLHSNYENDHG
jgi:hypothetical protein